MIYRLYLFLTLYEPRRFIAGQIKKVSLENFRLLYFVKAPRSNKSAVFYYYHYKMYVEEKPAVKSATSVSYFSIKLYRNGFINKLSRKGYIIYCPGKDI